MTIVLVIIRGKNVLQSFHNQICETNHMKIKCNINYNKTKNKHIY